MEYARLIFQNARNSVSENKSFSLVSFINDHKRFACDGNHGSVSSKRRFDWIKMSKRFWCCRTFLSVYGFKKRSSDWLILERYSNAGKTQSLAGVSLPFGKGFRCKEKRYLYCTYCWGCHNIQNEVLQKEDEYPVHIQPGYYSLLLVS